MKPTTLQKAVRSLNAFAKTCPEIGADVFDPSESDFEYALRRMKAHGIRHYVGEPGKSGRVCIDCENYNNCLKSKRCLNQKEKSK